MKKIGVLFGLFLLSISMIYAAISVNSNAATVKILTSPSSITNFLDLKDTPSSYSGQGTNCLIVNAGETALEFGSCGVGGGGGGDKWVDNGTYISPNSTYADNIQVHNIHSLDWSNVSITESQISDLTHTTDSVGQNSTWEGNQTNYYNITIMNSIISGNISSLYTIINLNVSSIYSVLINNISSIYGLITGNLSLGYAYSNTNILGNRSALDGNILGNKSADGVGQNATFIGTNYTGNINETKLATYYYWNNTYNGMNRTYTDANYVLYTTLFGYNFYNLSNFNIEDYTNLSYVNTNILGNRSAIDENILGNKSVGQNVTFNSINITQNITMQFSQYLCFRNSSHNCAKWILSNDSGVYIYGG